MNTFPDINRAAARLKVDPDMKALTAQGAAFSIYATGDGYLYRPLPLVITRKAGEHLQEWRRMDPRDAALIFAADAAAYAFKSGNPPRWHIIRTEPMPIPGWLHRVKKDLARYFKSDETRRRLTDKMQRFEHQRITGAYELRPEQHQGGGRGSLESLAIARLDLADKMNRLDADMAGIGSVIEKLDPFARDFLFCRYGRGFGIVAAGKMIGFNAVNSFELHRALIIDIAERMGYS